MDKQLIVTKLVSQELQRCQKLHDKMQRAYYRLPKGSLTCRDGRLIHCVREQGKQYAITVKENDSIVTEIKYRQYIKKALPILKQKIETYKKFLSHDLLYDPKQIEQELSKPYHGLQQLDVFLEEDINVDRWKKEKYKKNSMAFREAHYTSKGVQCRSKSEALIGIRLEERGILYRYDSKIKLGNKTVCPDFKILLPKRRKIVYWEHFGMLHDTNYTVNAFEKLDLYGMHQIFLGDNLFITSETKANPLNMKMIDEVIDRILLMDSIQ